MKRDRTPVVIGSVVGLVTIFAIFMLFQRGLLVIPNHEEPAGRASPGREAVPPPGDPAECKSLALQVWTRFVESPDIEGMIREVRDSGRVGPLMREFYGRRGHSFPTMAKVSAGKVASSVSREAVLFAIEPFSGPIYAVALNWDDGFYRIDWESLVAYGTVDWYEFTEGKSGSTERLRVFLSPLKDRWNHPALPVRAKSYLMEHRDSTDPVVAVSMAPESMTVDAMVTQPRTPVRVAVRWDREFGCFRIEGSPVVSWSD